MLGPYESWMEYTNGLRQVGDIGGPMDIGNGYRWNVPVVTYGFDQSFLDYFGTNGVAAVAGAIQFLNNLPPASQMAFTNFPLNSRRFNYNAESQNLVDLKSTTLAVLLEQMGLAQPTRYVFVLKQWTSEFLDPPFEGEDDWFDWAIPEYIVQRNFDPETLSATSYVNGNLYDAYIQETGYSQDMVISPVNPESSPNYSAVADCNSANNYEFGGYYMGLTEDDVGGLGYLYSTNNVNFENLLPGVDASAPTRVPIVNGALRPGIDKLTFIPQPTDPSTGKFLTMTTPYTDTYIINGLAMQQQVQRVISQPDILFCAAASGASGGFSIVDRTGTTNWINNAALNGNPTNGGPGVIQPQVKIAFTKIAHVLSPLNDESVVDYPFLWGSFDGTTNPPIVYPIPQSGTKPFTISMSLTIGSPPYPLQREFDWPLTNSIGSVSLFQTSTNLADWVTMFAATNDGTFWSFYNYSPTSAYRFYRVSPSPLSLPAPFNSAAP